MAVLNLDFSASDSGELLPEGSYNVVIDKVEVRLSQNSGNTNLSWTCTIADGPHSGRKCWLTTGTTEKSLWKLKETLQALGVYEEGMALFADDSSNLIIQPRLSGLPATAVVKHREYQGKIRAGIESLVGKNGASPTGPQFR